MTGPTKIRRAIRPTLLSRAPWLLAVVALLALVAVHAFAVRDSVMPIYWEDETGYLLNGLVLAGGESPDLGGKAYYLGWSLLIAPLWLLSSDPETVYRMAVLMSAGFGVLLAVPLAAIARRLGARTPWAILIGAAVAAAPGRVVMSNFVLAENFLAFATACTVWAALRFHARSTVGRAIVLGLLSSLVFLVHARALAITGATVLWMLVELVRALRGRSTSPLGAGPARRRGVLAPVAGLAAVLVPSAVGFLVYRGISSAMYPSSVDREADGVARLIDLDPVAFLKSLWGQTWYSAAAWIGLAVVGAILLALRAWGEVRRRRDAGRLDARRPGTRRPGTRRLGVGTWGLIGFAGIAVLSAAFTAKPIANEVTRLDLLSYGRYIDPFLAVVVVIGLTHLVRAARRGVVLAALGAAVVLSLVQLLVLLPVLPSGPGRWWAPVSSAGLLQYPWPDITAATEPPYLIASIVAVVALVLLGALALLGRRRLAPVAVLLALGFFGGSAAYAENRTVQPFFDHYYDSFALRETVEQYEDEPISFDLGGLGDQAAQGSGSDTISRNAYQFWLAGHEVPVFDSADSEPPTELVISRKDWVDADELGARLVAVDSDDRDNALWVLPGALQDTLEAEGALIP